MADLRKTPCTSWHVKAGAKMVPFAGYLMPVTYAGLIEEHLNVRQNAGLFDVSHMGELFVEGREAQTYLQRMVAADITRLSPGNALYSVFCNEKGGIIDDIIVYQLEEHRYLVCSNAATTDKDFAWLNLHKGSFQVTLRNESSSYGQFAIQGPKAEEILSHITGESMASCRRFQIMRKRIAETDTWICRTGYTGEDGFEIFLPASCTLSLWETFISVGADFKLMPIGLGARDTLRLEQGYLLYGQDIDETTTPLEAGIGWAIALDTSFIGAEALRVQKQSSLQKRLIAFVMEGSKIPRHGYCLALPSGEDLGTVTSGTFSPSLKKGIGMGYVAPQYANVGQELAIAIRSKFAKCKIVKPPFIVGSARRKG